MISVAHLLAPPPSALTLSADVQQRHGERKIHVSSLRCTYMSENSLPNDPSPPLVISIIGAIWMEDSEMHVDGLASFEDNVCLRSGGG